MSVSPAVPVSAEPAAGLSQVERVVDTFIAPSKTFTDILRSTSWWLPFLLMVLSTTALNVVIDRQVGFDRVYANQVASSAKQSERLDGMEPAQKAQAMAVGTKFTRGFTFGFPVFLLVILLLYALIVWGCFNFGLGAQTTFAQVFAVTWYAALPNLLLPVIAIAAIYLGNGADSYDLRNPVGTNLAYYLSGASPMVRGTLQSLDVLKLWSVGLQIVGMAIVARKTMVQSAIVVGGLWFLARCLLRLVRRSAEALLLMETSKSKDRSRSLRDDKQGGTHGFR